MKRRMIIFFYSIMAVFVIMVVQLAIFSYEQKTDPEYISGIGAFKVMHMITGSMNPEIKVGDIVIAKAIEAASLKTGDIITFRTSENILVTHRINGINEDGSFITKGDANAVEDIGIKVNKNNIIGRYVFKIPKGAYIAEFFKSRSGMLLFLLFMILSLQSNLKHIMKKVNISP